MTTEITRVAIDPFGADIPAETARLRELGSVVPVDLPGGIPAWAPTGFASLRALMLDPRVSKDPRLHWSLFDEAKARPEWSWILGWVDVVNMLNTYGPDHTRLRKLVSPSFTHKRTEAMRAQVEEITADLLAGLDAAAAAAPGEPVDVKARYAQPLPMRLICELFGVPEHLREAAVRMMDDIFDTSDPSPERAAAVQEQIGAVLPALIAYKSENPGNDMATELIRVRDEEGGRLTDDELFYTFLLVIGAGFETTVNLIGNAIVTLLNHPDQLAAVRAGEVGWEAVIEEVLRVHPSIASLPLRYAVSDITIDGVTIRAGDAIVTTFAAAGNDPAQYGPDAAEFDIHRGADEHLSFGIGVHRCVGAPLARMEALTALPALFDRFPDIRLAVSADQLEQVPSFVALGWQRVPVLLHGR
ncbi:cytochrome P450 [Streptomyces sp. NPDC058653]|uniref:cytochrome P450 family protein n=1 Tax=Streptomyces sp. NPDC058653 TaxID=3346576 RepID=UPI00364FAAB3